MFRRFRTRISKRVREYQFIRKVNKFHTRNAPGRERDPNIHMVFKREGKIVVGVHDLSKAFQEYGDDPDVVFEEIEPMRPLILDPNVGEVGPLDTARYRPVPGGCSTGHFQITAGTLGHIVRNKNSGKLAMVSNNHVLANVNDANTGDSIFQPGPADGGGETDLVARLAAFVPLEENQANYVDIAIADFEDNIETDLGVIFVGKAHGVCEAYPEQRLWDRGRTTHEDRGKVIDPSASVTVYYAPDKEYNFQDVILSDIRSEGGDSGTSEFDFASNQWVGTLFAGGGGYTVICKATRILEALPQIELLPPAPPERSMIIDISHWQGVVDFKRFKSRGVHGVYMKFSQGGNIIDPRAEENYLRAKAEGLLVGPYIFVDNNYTAQQHMDKFLEIAEGKTFDMPPALDVETRATELIRERLGATFDIYSEDEAKNWSGIVPFQYQLTAVVQQLAALTSEWHGSPCTIYTRASFWNLYILPWSGWSQYYAWLARWHDGIYDPNAPPGEPIRDWERYDYALWQFQVIQVNDWGVESKSLDFNVSGPRFDDMLSGSEPPPPTNEPEVTILEPEDGAQFEAGMEIHFLGTATDVEDGDLSGSLVWASDIEGELHVGAEFERQLDEGDHVISASVVDSDGHAAQQVVQVSVAPEPPPPGRTEFITYRGRTTINLNYRTGPGTGNTRLGTLPAGTVVDILEEAKDAEGNDWVRIGYRQWCARLYRGNVYVEFL